MNRWMFAVLSSAVLFVVQGCSCKLPHYAPNWDPRTCRAHIEPPFDISKVKPGELPGPGLVFGTADFSGTGTVLIKVQVEDLASVPGNQATISVWSGNGEAPAPGTVAPPPGGTQVYTTGSNATLRFYTTHLDRTYDPAINKYWLLVCVAHDNGDVRYLVHTWVPSSTVSPDSPHDFDSN